MLNFIKEMKALIKILGLADGIYLATVCFYLYNSGT